MSETVMCPVCKRPMEPMRGIISFGNPSGFADIYVVNMDMKKSLVVAFVCPSCGCVQLFRVQGEQPKPNLRHSIYGRRG
jgi:hypothetical protein